MRSMGFRVRFAAARLYFSERQVRANPRQERRKHRRQRRTDSRLCTPTKTRSLRLFLLHSRGA